MAMGAAGDALHEHELAQYLGTVAEVHRGLAGKVDDPAVTVLRAVLEHVALILGCDLHGVGLALLAHPGRARRLPELAPPVALAEPDLLGRVHEVLVGSERRRRSGVHYTPGPVAAAAVGWALEVADEKAGGEASEGRYSVCDPAVGGGVFLLAAAEALLDAGRAPADVIEHCLFGADIDPTAVAVTEASLSLWAAIHRTSARVPAGHLRVADGLQLDGGDWPGARPFDAVVGNPPFLGQMQRATARHPAEAARLRPRFGAAAHAYADTSALMLLSSCRSVRPGGAVAMVLPRSFLVTRHVAEVRRAVLEVAALEALWAPEYDVFGTGVDVCVPVLRVGAATGQVRRLAGVSARCSGAPVVAAPALFRSSTWAYLVADATGIPDVDLDTERTLDAVCRATAGFRDEYYGLVPYVVEGAPPRHQPGLVPLLTSGLIDPAVCRWGSRPARFARRRWSAPAVDLPRLEIGADERLVAWVRARLEPKVLVATQTRVVEAVVDPDGAWLPSTPVISVSVPPGRLWHVAAALLSPPLTAWALRHHRGAALAPDAVKLGARDLLSFPAPAEGEAWDVAAIAVQAAHGASSPPVRRRYLVEAGEAMCVAYGVDGGQIVDWWSARLPNRE